MTISIILNTSRGCHESHLSHPYYYNIYVCICPGTAVISIGLNENTVYWTNGSIVLSVELDDTSSEPSIFASFNDDVVFLHTLSPGQQPLYCKYLLFIWTLVFFSSFHCNRGMAYLHM